ncbi:MAG TPA: alpha/beta fold hydrolase [Thermoanaerobaculia bacterium]
MPRSPFPALLLALAAALAPAAAQEASQETRTPPPDDPSRWARLAAERLSELEVCRPAGAEEDMLCGTLEVWEDREARAGRKIGLAVVVVPARTADPEPDPFVPIPGGPGQGITHAAPYVPGFAGHLLDRRDVLLVDLRGTGKSNPLQCNFGVTPETPQPAYDGFLPTKAVERCKEELEERADLTKYTTTILAADLEEVRRRLGYGPLNLDGGSYGTRFAQEFLRRYPESVRAAILHGVVLMDHRMPLNHALDAQRSLDLLLLLCEEDPACSGAFPNLRDELWTVLERLETEPGRATIENPLTGKEVTLAVGRGMFGETLRSLLYNVQSSAELPFVVHRAFHRDFAPFFRATLPYRVFVDLEVAIGLYLSVTCAEDTYRFTEREAALHDAGTFLGSLRSDAQKAACDIWPKGEIPEDFHDWVETDRPVLLTVGELDPVTPPRYARAVAEHMPNSRLVVVPGGNHGIDSLTNLACFEALAPTFFETGTTESLDTTCVQTMERPPFVLEESGMSYLKK